MCRLLAHVARRPLTVAEAVGSDLAEFADLSPRHPDGWGMAWWPTRDAAAAGGPPERTRAIGRARDAPAFVESTRIPASAALVHLRGATRGLAIGLENCHPFVSGRAAFAQNGALFPQERLPELLPPALEARVAGSTDSERLFLLLHDRFVGSARPFPEIVRDTLIDVLQTFTSPVLNAVYLAADALYVLNAHNPTTLPYAGDPDDLFALRVRVDDDLVVVASSGFDQRQSRGWWTLDNMTVLTVPFDTLALRIDPLDGVPIPAYTYPEVA